MIYLDTDDIKTLTHPEWIDIDMKDQVIKVQDDGDTIAVILGASRYQKLLKQAGI